MGPSLRDYIQDEKAVNKSVFAWTKEKFAKKNFFWATILDHFQAYQMVNPLIVSNLTDPV